MPKEKEVKKITIGFIFSWIFGVLFLLAGAGAIATFPILGTIIILCSVMIIPYFNKVIAEKLHFKISGGIKFLLVIIIFVAIGMTDTTKKIYQSNQIVQEDNVQLIGSKPVLNKKTEYVKNFVKLEKVEIGKGYGQFDMPGYSKKKPTIQGRIKNTGTKILEVVKITVYFLDRTKTRIGEKEYYPINTYSILGDHTPLKPNYVRDWGYVIDDAPSGWAKKVEVVISDITFRKE